VKIKSLTIFIACLLLSCFAVPVLTACCPPPKPPCYRCENGVWVWNCSAGQNCCGGSCCSNKCCNGVCCPAGQICCGGVCCDTWTKECCDDSDCPNPACQECVDCKCQLKAGAECQHTLDCPMCHDCTNCECVNRCNPATQCCDESTDTCVNKCTNDAAVCEFEVPDWDVDCTSKNPEDTSCQTGVAGILCGTHTYYWTTTAKCANCAPGCATTYTGPCADIYPVRCKNVLVFPIYVCRCEDQDATPQHSGSRHQCLP
jgi:hypothetical protein